MTFSLIICTYMRPKPLLKLLQSVQNQTLYPDELLIIDGSTDNKTREVLEKNHFKNLNYFLIDETKRGLVKQRNYGIEKVANGIDIICFLDDDTILTSTYFESLIATYSAYPQAVGVGGYITNEVSWKKVNPEETRFYDDYVKDAYVRKMGSRFVLRKRLGLLPKAQPCMISEFSHGYSVSFLPPSGKIYEAQFFMGGVSSFKKELFKKIKFSNYFVGYGLYEDADFCLRASKFGTMYVNTAAQLGHFHEPDGRPNKFNYGKMVVRNGWYVWRVGNPNPSLNARIKWHLITLLLTLIKFSNIFTSLKWKEAFTEAIGRSFAWWRLLIDKPKVLD